MRTKAQIRRRKEKRQARKLYNKAHPKIRDYRLYALKLEDGRYYVGMTSYKDATKRYNQHLEGKGAKWTKLYKPLSIIEIVELGMCTESIAATAETELTMQYMEKYGISYVRGGALCYMSDNLCKLNYNRFARVVVTSPATNTKRMRQEQSYQEKLAKELSWI